MQSTRSLLIGLLALISCNSHYKSLQLSEEYHFTPYNEIIKDKEQAKLYECLYTLNPNLPLIKRDSIYNAIEPMMTESRHGTISGERKIISRDMKSFFRAYRDGENVIKYVICFNKEGISVYAKYLSAEKKLSDKGVKNLLSMAASYRVVSDNEKPCLDCGEFTLEINNVQV